MMTTYTPSSGKILFQQLEDLEKMLNLTNGPLNITAIFHLASKWEIYFLGILLMC